MSKPCPSSEPLGRTRKGRPSTSSGKAGRGKAARPIALVGMPGTGKSVVGRLLAKRLALPFVDSDAEIERRVGTTIAEIFERDGEVAFRGLERAAIGRLLNGMPLVLATGGGAMADTGSRALLLDRASTVWLDAPVQLLVQRLAGTAARPLLQGDPAARLIALKAERDQFYALAQHRSDASGPPGAVAADIIETLANAGR